MSVALAPPPFAAMFSASEADGFIEYPLDFRKFRVSGAHRPNGIFDAT
jgi:hypothetical protein